MSIGSAPIRTDEPRRSGTLSYYRPPRTFAGLAPRTPLATRYSMARPEATRVSASSSAVAPEARPRGFDTGRSESPRVADSARDSNAAGRRDKKRILVVDDEKDIVETVAYNLRRNGFDTLVAENGLDAIDLAQVESPDLILLDLMLPGIDGNEVARRLKADARTASIPIIMLTAKAEETDVVVGLTLGADDYVTKPFSMKILLARMNSVLRRTEQGGDADATPDAEGTLKAGPLSIDTSKHEVTVDGEQVRLTLTEFRLLSALVSARGRVLTRDQLMDKAMGADVFVTDRAIDVHVTAIRKKLADAHWLVHTVRGVGYRLQETPDESA